MGGSEHDAHEVMVALRRIVRYLRLADREAETRSGVSAAQLFVLHALADGPARSLAELAERTLTDQSSVSTVVSRLVARRLVIRKISRVDRRRTELSLTAAGRRIVATGPSAPQTAIIRAIESLPARRRATLVDALASLAHVIGAEQVAPRMLFEDEPERRRRR